MAIYPATNVQVREADEYMRNALVNIVLGKPENFNAQWNILVEDLYRMGIEEANSTLTAMIQDKIELWSR